MEYYLYNNNLYSSSELYHWGVLGMKWGVRRYQNPDGTLTAAGKKRYYVSVKDSSETLNKRGLKLRKKVRKEAYKDPDVKQLLREYRKEYKQLQSTKTNPHAKMLIKEMKKEWSKYSKARKKFATTRLEKDKNTMDLLYQKYKDSERALMVANEADSRALYRKYLSQISTATLKRLGSEQTDNGRRFVEDLIGNDFRIDQPLNHDSLY